MCGLACRDAGEGCERCPIALLFGGHQERSVDVRYGVILPLMVAVTTAGRGMADGMEGRFERCRGVRRSVQAPLFRGRIRAPKNKHICGSEGILF